jgi:hypothetical protein
LDPRANSSPRLHGPVHFPFWSFVVGLSNLVLDFFNKIRHPVEVNGPDIHYRIIALAGHAQ